MSDIQNEETQAIVDVVKSAVDGAVEIKADKAEVAELKSELEALKAVEAPSVEGFVKAEDLALVKSALDELTATFKAAPAVLAKEAKPMHKGFNWISADDNGFNAKTSVNLAPMILKAENDTSDISNAPVTSARTFWEAVQTNPMRMVSGMMPTSAGTFFLPSITGITAQVESAIPASINTASGHGGALAAENQVIMQNFTSRTLFSDQSVEDLPMLDGMIAGFMGNRIGELEATDMVSQLNSATVTEVNTGQAAALPDSLDEWAELVSSLSSAYKPNARFVMSREALENLRTLAQQGTGSPLVIDPSNGAFRLWGYDILVNDHFDAGDTAGDNPVYFGDFAQGTIIGVRKEMTISRHEDTIPGGVYFYGNMRSRGTVWNAAAIRRFNVAA